MSTRTRCSSVIANWDDFFVQQQPDEVSAHQEVPTGRQYHQSPRQPIALARPHNSQRTGNGHPLFQVINKHPLDCQICCQRTRQQTSSNDQTDSQYKAKRHWKCRQMIAHDVGGQRKGLTLVMPRFARTFWRRQAPVRQAQAQLAQYPSPISSATRPARQQAKHNRRRPVQRTTGQGRAERVRGAR